MRIASLGLEEMSREEAFQSQQRKTFGTHSSILLVEEKSISYELTPAEATPLDRPHCVPSETTRPVAARRRPTARSQTTWSSPSRDTQLSPSAHRGWSDPATARTRNTATAPSQPTEALTCAVSANL